METMRAKLKRLRGERMVYSARAKDLEEQINDLKELRKNETRKGRAALVLGYRNSIVKLENEKTRVSKKITWLNKQISSLCKKPRKRARARQKKRPRKRRCA